jgi:hypothetical protein
MRSRRPEAIGAKLMRHVASASRALRSSEVADGYVSFGVLHQRNRYNEIKPERVVLLEALTRAWLSRRGVSATSSAQSSRRHTCRDLQQSQRLREASCRDLRIGYWLLRGNNSEGLRRNIATVNGQRHASIIKTIETEGLSLTTKTLSSFNSQSYVAKDRQNLLLPQER